MGSEIDIVMPWVDDGDPEWRKSRAAWSGEESGTGDGRDMRYRDWGLLRYWFRGIEKFAPWARRVYFITCGHVPDWLNPDAPKLVHVKHSDYIPQEYLPTFSSHPIELNIHRIPELSERFVYFNDDMFLTGPTGEETFFRNGLPCHTANLHAIFPRGQGGVMPHVYVNTVMAVNRHFDMRTVLKKDRKKWFSLRDNGIRAIIENLYSSRFPEFPGFKNDHLPEPVLKSTMEEAWRLEGEVLSETCSHKFRDMRDVSMYLFKYWELASGNFVPKQMGKLGSRIDIGNNLEEICRKISRQEQVMLCLNDMGDITDPDAFQSAKARIGEAFETILPEKSAFEK